MTAFVSPLASALFIVKQQLLMYVSGRINKLPSFNVRPFEGTLSARRVNAALSPKVSVI